MPQLQGTIEHVQASPLQNGSTRYDVTINGQQYGTFDPALARTAQDHLGQMVVALVSQKPSRDGMRMFNNFDGIVGAQPELGGGIPMGGGMIPQGAQQIPVQQPPRPSGYGGGMSPEREAKIVKQSSMASAFNFVGQLWQGAGPEAAEAAEEQAMALAKRLYVQVMGAPQTLEDEIVDSLVAAAPEQSQQGELGDW